MIKAVRVQVGLDQPSHGKASHKRDDLEHAAQKWN